MGLKLGTSRNDTECRQDLEVIVVLEDERKVCSLGTNTEV
jgi:hypothetical protein